MEDRNTEGLYLELADAKPDDYARSRVPEIAGLDDVSRASWWENLRPGRDEFPRSLDEFTTLGVYEVGDGFAAPATLPAGIAGHHFRRTARPPQGSLSGRPTVGLLLVLVSPKTPAGAAALRDWADFVHIREIAAAGIEGFTMISPYANAASAKPRFLHFYEMDAEDPEAAFQSMVPKVTERRLSERGTPGYESWFSHPELVIDYVNTFRIVGSSSTD